MNKGGIIRVESMEVEWPLVQHGVVLTDKFQPDQVDICRVRVVIRSVPSAWTVGLMMMVHSAFFHDHFLLPDNYSLR